MRCAKRQPGNRWAARAMGSDAHRASPPSSAASTTGPLDSWDKVPDATILRLNTADAVTVEAITKCIGALITAMDIKDLKFKVRAPNAKVLATRWIVDFPDSSPAGDGAAKVLTGIRAPDGWRHLVCATPSSGTTNVYIGPDKNIRQIRQEVSAKALCKLLGSMYPAQNFVHRKSDGSISCDYRRMARVVVSPDTSVLEFNLPVLGELGFPFDKEEVKRKWNLDPRGGAATWGS